MAETIVNQPIQPIQQGTPPTIHVSQLACAITATDILTSVGHHRVIMQPDQTGTPTPNLFVEWLMTMSMSATAAKQYHQILGAVLQEYEKTFGAIPTDKAAILNLTGGQFSASGEIKP